MGTRRDVALVTGATGFAGTHLMRELERTTSWDLVGLSQRARPITGRATLLTCDLLDAELVHRVFERWRPTIVVHLAAQTYVPKSFASPATTLTNNILAQLHVLEACRALDQSPLVLVVGSSEEYGHVSPDELPITERQPFRPGNPYAVSKVTQDMLGLQYFLAHGLRIVRVRPFNHCGPGQSDRFVLANFARQVVEAELERIEPVILTGDLSAERDFLDVRDVARAYRLAIEHGVPGEVYNIASGRSYAIGTLLDKLIALGRASVTVRTDPTRLRPSDTPRVVGDASAFRLATGWEPAISIDQSLRDIVADWRARLASPHTSTA